ncbi:MAG: permease [Lentimicrobiaceae bacterium]|nr:permease [Lentimicrobiaceae bacterium]
MQITSSKINYKKYLPLALLPVWFAIYHYLKPLSDYLIEKGASLGTALAFMMAVIGLSLPEMIILRKVLKLPLIFTFIGVVATGIIIIGFLFNIIF